MDDSYINPGLETQVVRDSEFTKVSITDDDIHLVLVHWHLQVLLELHRFLHRTQQAQMLQK
jgi:hypothetical protein